MLVFHSSDARPRYISDIATVLAEPVGGQFQFRYQSRYLAPDVLTMLGKGSLRGMDALVCFVGNRDSDTGQTYLIPVRLATVANVEQIADAYVFTLTAQEFPNLKTWPRQADALIQQGHQVVEQRVANNHQEYYAVNQDASSTLFEKATSVQEGWAGVAERLLLLPTFKSSYLLRVELADAKGSPIVLRADEEGWIEFDPRRSYRVRVWFYGDEATFGSRQLSLEADGEVLSSISDQTYRIRSRYDQVDFWFTPKVPEASKRTLLRLVSTVSDPTDVADIPTEVELRCMVTRPLAPRIGLAVLAGVSATAVAVPGLVADTVPIEWQILIAGTGALGVALAAGLR